MRSRIVWGLEELWSDVMGITAPTIGGAMISTVVDCMVKIPRNK